MIFHKRAEQVKQSINEKLFDRERGVYLDGEETEHASLHANMFPLAFGLTPDEYKSSVVDFIKNRGMACSVYGSQFLLEALYEAGEDEYALELMTSKTDRGWWHMIELGSTVTLEAWDLKYKGNLDWNHAWGAAPANIIPRWLMGIRPLEPGKTTISLMEDLGAKVRPMVGNAETAFRLMVQCCWRCLKSAAQLTWDKNTAEGVLKKTVERVVKATSRAPMP